MAGDICQHTVTDKDGQTFVCGQVHDPRKCRSHSSIREDDGKAWDGTTRKLVGVRPCGQWKLKGLDVCGSHGGKAAQTKAKAAAVVAEEKVRKTLGRLQVVPVDNPLVELQTLGGKAKAWMDLCEAHVAELERMRYASEGGEHIRGEVQLFERAMEQCRKVLVDIARLNIDERLAAIEQRKLDLVADAIGKVFGEMGLSTDQQREARNGLARHLRVVAG